jgi:CheY-like chemotaxis protein
MATVLIVDDAPDFRSMARVLAESRGRNVLQACDGPVALTILLRAQPDLMLLDVHMPAMNGLDVLSTLRSNGRLLRPRRIVMVSADTDPGLRQDALELGADAFVDKVHFCAATIDEALSSLQASGAVRRSA